MKKRMCIITVLTLAFVVGLLLLSRSEASPSNAKEAMQTTGSVTVIESSDVMTYSGDVYINGIPVDELDAAIVYQGKIHLCSDVLSKYVSNWFCREEKGQWLFRRNNYLGSYVVFQGKVYFPLDAITLYIRANSHHLASGTLYLISNPASNINFGKNAYQITKTISDVPTGQYAGLTEDGRAVYQNQNDLWVETDTGNYILFIIPKYDL